MPMLSVCNYAVVRVVPRVERGEFLNAGVLLFCRERRFLGARVELNEHRLAALAPGLALAPIRQHLALIPRICCGGNEGGPIGKLSLSERFHWLVAPRSTIVQTSPVHCCLCTDSKAMLEHLLVAMVR